MEYGHVSLERIRWTQSNCLEYIVHEAFAIACPFTGGTVP